MALPQANDSIAMGTGTDLARVVHKSRWNTAQAPDRDTSKELRALAGPARGSAWRYAFDCEYSGCALHRAMLRSLRSQCGTREGARSGNGSEALTGSIQLTSLMRRRGDCSVRADPALSSCLSSAVEWSG